MSAILIYLVTIQQSLYFTPNIYFTSRQTFSFIKPINLTQPIHVKIDLKKNFFKLSCETSKEFVNAMIVYIFFNDTHREKLCFTQFSRRIYLFRMFTQSIKFYTSHCHILKGTDV